MALARGPVNLNLLAHPGRDIPQLPANGDPIMNLNNANVPMVREIKANRCLLKAYAEQSEKDFNKAAQTVSNERGIMHSVTPFTICILVIFFCLVILYSLSAATTDPNKIFILSIIMIILSAIGVFGIGVSMSPFKNQTTRDKFAGWPFWIILVVIGGCVGVGMYFSIDKINTDIVNGKYSNSWYMFFLWLIIIVPVWILGIVSAYVFFNSATNAGASFFRELYAHQAAAHNIIIILISLVIASLMGFWYISFRDFINNNPYAYPLMIGITTACMIGMGWGIIDSIRLPAGIFLKMDSCPHIQIPPIVAPGVPAGGPVLAAIATHAPAF